MSLSDGARETLDRCVRGSPASGIAASCWIDGRAVWSGSAGTTTPDGGVPLAPCPLFPIYSVTKTFTAACALRLCEQRTFALDDPIDRWLPELPFAADVTLRQLLGHTAGVFNYSELAEYHDAVRRHPERPWSFEEFVAKTCHRPLLFPPGSSWRYSNTGYTLLRRILEETSGLTLGRLVAREIGAPLGLDATRELATLDDLRHVVPGFSRLFAAEGAADPPIDVRDCYHPGWCGTGLLASTADEVCRFFDALLAGRLLSPKSLEAMTTGRRVPGEHPPAVSPSYGLGIMSDPEAPGGPWYGHGGGGPGWSIHTGSQPTVEGHRMTITVFCNTDGEISAPVVSELAQSIASSRDAE